MTGRSSRGGRRPSSPLRALAVLVLGLAACQSSSGPAFRHVPPAPALAASSVVAHVQDARERADPATKIEVPIITFPGQGQEADLALDPALGENLAEALRARLAPGALALRLEVTVNEARVSWKARALSEKARASAKVDVEVWDDAANRRIAAGPGASWGELELDDVSASLVQDVLERVVCDAVYAFLRSPGSGVTLVR